MIIKFFSLPKLAIGLLAILAISSIIGTIIPQNEHPHFYIYKYGHSLYSFFKAFSLTDLYHSWWFMGILVLISINIIACFLNRLSSTLKRPGFCLIHLGILIVLTGGIIGNRFGFKEYINIYEKGVINVPSTDFYIQLDNFEIEYYPNSVIKDYKSTLTIIERDKRVMTKTIEVNHPLKYKGIWFYQESYGSNGGKEYSGLQIVKDPGVPVVWGGCGLLVLGLIISFKQARRDE